MKTILCLGAMLLASTLVQSRSIACDLKVDSAWIRVAPGNASVLAGYAVLSNVGSKPLGVVSAQSAAFAKVEMHESLTENGIAKMRPVKGLVIPAGGKQLFAPGGKHFMLIDPKATLRSGDVVAVKLKDSTGCETAVDFKVGGMGSGGNVDQSGGVDHANGMDHSQHH